MSRLPCQGPFRAVSASARTASLVALLSLLGAAAITTPAKAAVCQAINASSLLGNTPTAPSPACTTPISVGDTFEIDFSDVFLNNSSDFSLSNTYSLQVANINPTSPGSQLSFSNVELLVTGSFGMMPITTPTAVSIWQASGQQTGQGFSNYSTNGTGQDFGFGEAFKSANFTLSAPQTPGGAFGIAGVINTLSFNLASAGISSFTGAKIRGTLSGASGIISGNPDFSAGLAIFSTNDPMMQPPNLIYGNAFNAVPGPLPIVGAGAAFGWSRRLRRRVRKAAAVPSLV